MARPKKLLTEVDIANLNSITRGDSTAAVGYRLAAVRAYVSHSAEEVASFFDTEPETVIRWASKFHSLLWPLSRGSFMASKIRCSS